MLILIILGAFTTEAQERPCLIFSNENISQLKGRLKTDTSYQTGYAKVKTISEKALGESMPYEKLEHLALVYLVEHKPKVKEKIIETIAKLSKHGSLEPLDMLHREPAWRSQLATARANYNMAVAYDAIYQDISAEMRDSLAKCIYDASIEPTLHDWLNPLTRHHTINSMGHNYWMACIGNCAIACMAIEKEMPELKSWIEAADRAVSEWVRFNGDFYQNKPQSIDNGAYYESVNYANYGMSQYLLYRFAKGNRNSGNYNISDSDRKIAEYFMHTCYPVSEGKMPSLYFGDGDEYSNGEMCVKLLYAMGARDDNMLWYLSQITPDQHREGLSLSSPLGLLITPEAEAELSLPSLPKHVAYLANGWASIRDSWACDKSLLGVKCGHTWNHAHADAASFILYHNGLPVIKDAGNCWYPNPNYRNYFFQSQAHNVLMVDGNAQPPEHQYQGSYSDGRITDVTEGKGIRFISADASGPTGKYFQRNLRSFLWIDNVILVIDDARSFDYGEFSWTLHPGMPSAKEGVDIMIENGDSKVAVRPLWPEYLTESEFEHDFPFNLKAERHEAPKAKQLTENEAYYTVRDPRKRNEQKFVTAIMLPDSCGKRARVTRLEVIDGYGVRIDDGINVTDVYLNSRADGHIMHRNSCHTLGQFDTDAYILAYSYPAHGENASPEINRYFMAYGSYVRESESNSPIFDSFTKQTKIW
ncbi:MAG: heparinase II/III-family protein [Clostridium sp.]|nr:heparinase II/III-family protein [Clostridium sp.]